MMLKDLSGQRVAGINPPNSKLSRLGHYYDNIHREIKSTKSTVMNHEKPLGSSKGE